MQHQVALRVFSCLFKQDILLEPEASVARFGLKVAAIVVVKAPVACPKLKADLRPFLVGY